MSRFRRDDQILAGIGLIAVIASLVVGATTNSQSKGNSRDAGADATSQAASHSEYRGSTWD
jgi:hypothetical protein